MDHSNVYGAMEMASSKILRGREVGIGIVCMRNSANRIISIAFLET